MTSPYLIPGSDSKSTSNLVINQKSRSIRKEKNEESDHISKTLSVIKLMSFSS